MRFHLVDRAEEICFDKYITGVKCISLADDVFNEHFPGYPIFPGTLIIEGLAQMAGSFFELIMKNRGEKDKRAVLSIVDKIKLKKPAFPGDRLVYRAEILSMNEEFGAVKVQAQNEGEISLTGTLFFSFVEISSTTLQNSRNEIHDIFMRNVRIVNS